MLYGTLDADKTAEENLLCRKIVKEITEMGLTQRQIWFTMYLLGLSLENVEDCKMATDFIKEYKGSEIFLNKDEGNG